MDADLKKADDLLNQIIADAPNDYFYSLWHTDKMSSVRKKFPANEESRACLLYYSSKALQLPKSERNTKIDNVIYYILSESMALLQDFDDEKLYTLIKNWYLATRNANRWFFPEGKIFKVLEGKIKTHGLTDSLRKSLEFVKETNEYYLTQEARKRNEKIELILQGSLNLPIHPQDRWAPVILQYINSIEDAAKKELWIDLVNLCISMDGKATPTQKWLEKSKKLVTAIGQDEYARKLMEWASLIKEILQEIHKTKGHSVGFLADLNHELFKGLIWAAVHVENKQLIMVLDDYASWAYKKKLLVGPITAKTGNACMYLFSQLPVPENITRLMKFRMKIKNNTIIKSIDKILKEASTRNNISMDMLEEMGVSDFGLDAEGVLRKTFGEFTAVYTLKSLNESELIWEKDGIIQKGVPQNIKTNFAAELKELKNQIKELESLLPLLKERIESSYLKQKEWLYDQWKEYYLYHPVMAVLVKKLIWHFVDAGMKTEAIWINGNLVDVKGNPIQPANDTTVQLWHPIGFNSNQILAWRNFLLQHQIKQPFKQAHREIYLITDAELQTNTYSNRFAAHILRQHQFAALSRSRGWHYHLMGNWDSHNTPVKLLPGWNIRVEFYVDADWQGTTSDAGIFTYLATDQVRYYREDRLLSMHEIPALVFTEIMRDVDLFVGVCSIGNDPAWRDAGDNRMNTYWHDYSFGELTESAKVREEVLKTLIPRLKIRDRCSFDGKYLLVQGKIRKYKIHMGSGNILMEPNDQYLCIVPARSEEKSKEQVFLPFEGDQMLSVILSKALLLANDDKISDPTIISQIKTV
jgi:hypothetical protein